MPADLVGAKSPLNNPLLSLLGGLSNVNQSNVPARSNLEYSIGNLTDGALAATGIAAIVACPVDANTVVSKVSLLVGATAGATLTHGFAALYAGTGTAPALIGQSTDIGTTASITASTLYSFTLTTAQLITNALAPQNFVYVAIMFTQSAGTIPTVVSAGTPTGINYQYNGTASPLFLSMTAGSALTTAAAATIASASAKAVAPVVILT